MLLLETISASCWLTKLLREVSSVILAPLCLPRLLREVISAILASFCLPKLLREVDAAKRCSSKDGLQPAVLLPTLLLLTLVVGPAAINTPLLLLALAVGASSMDLVATAPRVVLIDRGLDPRLAMPELRVLGKLAEPISAAGRLPTLTLLLVLLLLVERPRGSP